MALSNAQWFANPGEDYTIDQSCLFDGSSSYLSRTPASASNRILWTQSVWVKRCYLDAFGGAAAIRYQYLLNTNTGQNDGSYFYASDTFEWIHDASQLRETDQRLMDVSAWYHLVWTFDSAQASEPNRSKLWINGAEVTDWNQEAEIGEDATMEINNTVLHAIGRNEWDDNNYFNGYMADYILIDGAALTADSFGETNSTTGQWVPIDPSGLTFGTNGFWLDFSDSTFLGKDARTSGDQVHSYASSQWSGATGSFSFTDGRIDTTGDNKAIKSDDTFAGDFEFQWRYVDKANWVIGVYETGEDGTFNDSNSNGGMASMTDSWYIQASSVSANNDIKYGSTTVVDSTTIANADVWNISRSSGTLKIERNGSTVHTWSQTSTNTVRMVFAQGDADADADSINWVDNSTLGNNWFSSGLAAADQMTDSPTNNHATLNPLMGPHSAINVYSLSDGNLVTNATGDTRGYGTIPFDVEDADGFYWEAKMTSAATYPNIAIRSVAAVNNEKGDPSATGRYNFVGSDGNFATSSGASSYGSAWSGTADIVLGVLSKAGSLYFSIDGTVQNSGTAAITGLTGHYIPLIFTDAGGGTPPSWEMRFAANMWSTTPSGYKAICTANLPDPTIADPSAYFQTTIYTGDGESSLAVNQAGNKTFEPGFVWIKNRDAADGHVLTDAVRGATKVVSSDSTAAETTDADTLTAFDSDGFTVGADVKVNTDTEKYVSWQWKTDGTSGSSNTDGTNITSTVSVNTTSGFSIVKYPGSGTASDTVGHGLGVTPELIMVRNLSEVSSWCVTHVSLATDKVLRLEGNEAEGDIGDGELDSPPNSSSVFGFNNGTSGTPLKVVNESGDDYIAYVAAGVEGFSKFGKYTGNGVVDGPFCWTGFKPRFLITKRINATEEWSMRDSARSGGEFGSAPGTGGDNPTGGNGLQWNIAANSSDAGEDSASGTRLTDFVSNGFKIRATNTAVNASGSTYIWMAFAESPFKNATAR